MGIKRPAKAYKQDKEDNKQNKKAGVTTGNDLAICTAAG